jgi:hypothetical protein
MDREQFDALTRMLAATPSRRAALGALLGAGLAGGAGRTAANARGNARTRHKAKGKNVAAQAADCLSPGHGTNLNGCNFNNRDFAGADLSSSSMRGTRFRGANLCGADLSSSQLRDADFRGFAAPGNATNLTRADLSSSGCNGTQFNSRTLFCNTKTCNGAISNRDCPQGIAPGDVCCTDRHCGPGRFCCGGVCRECCDTDDCAAGEVCVNNECRCVPATCASLNKNCGKWPDGCGGTLCCGRCDGATGCCADGTCSACPRCACREGPTIMYLADGSTLGSNGGGVCLSPCTSNADCGCGEYCVARYTLCLPDLPVTDCTSVGRPPGAYCASVSVCTP